MAWIWVFIFSVVWAVSLWKILNSSPIVALRAPISFCESGETRERKKVLFVIAHPDDESMFFSPSIISLISKGWNPHVLCISAGNAEDKGSLRKEELYRACAVLRIPSQQIIILDHPKLQDGFDQKWDHGLLATLIGEQMTILGIGTVITFDEFGISGHPNHRDVRLGLRKYLCEAKKKDDAWELVSKGILRKYVGPIDIWLSLLHALLPHLSQTRCLLLNPSPCVTYSAMAEHRTQWLWFRKLFVIFSSYTYMNTLRKVNY
ncbi:uncharacterized protein LOC144700448 [Wolffia australiana]